MTPTRADGKHIPIALERERRQAAAERDVEILAATGPDPELAGLAGYAAGVETEH
jgi:hypothetical protein